MEKGFWAVPKSVAKRKDLSLKAKLVAGILWSMRGSDSEVFPSRSYMAEALGTSTTTIDRGIRELREKAGLMVKRRGFGKSNCYLVPDWLESSEMTTLENSKLTALEEKRLTNHERARVKSIINNINIYTNVDDKESSVKEVFSYFRERVKAIKDFVPEINWAKDGKLAKKRLKNYSLEEIKQLIDWYLRSKHCQRLGVSLAVCLSGFVINLWKASKSKSNYLQKLYPTWQYKE
jgi:DNA-binding transcriptional regulator YhcF (GntR family)